MYGNPNYYTRADVLRLARLIDPLAWANVTEDREPKIHGNDDPITKSISIAGRVLMSGYRDCTIR